MIKKISSADGAKISKKIKNLKGVKRQKLKEQKPDTFERSAVQDTVKKNKNSYPSDCDNLRFRYQRIEFFPEDVEKMKHMTLKEENAYLSKLKAEKRYRVIRDPNEKSN